MAKISHCGRWVRATMDRVLSAIPAYKYQRLYSAKCSRCRKRVRYWCGEFANGVLTELVPVSLEEYNATWKRRLKEPKPKPPLKVTSDYTIRMKGPIEQQLKYLNKLEWVQRLPILDSTDVTPLTN